MPDTRQPHDEPTNQSEELSNAAARRLEASLSGLALAAIVRERAAHAPGEQVTGSVIGLPEAINIELKIENDAPGISAILAEVAGTLPAGWSLWKNRHGDLVPAEAPETPARPRRRLQRKARKSAFITAFPPADSELTSQEAWHLAHRLMEHAFVASAEVLLAVLQVVEEPAAPRPDAAQPPSAPADGGVPADALGALTNTAHTESHTESLSDWIFGKLMPADDPVSESEVTRWHLDRLHVPQAQALLGQKLGADPARPTQIKTAQPVTVAVLDTGYTRHPEILRTFYRGKNYFRADDGLDPLQGLFASHGTAGISVIASAPGGQPGTSGRAVEGIAPFARIMPVRMTKSVVLAPGHIVLGTHKLVLALDYAVENGADVISMAVGSITGWRELCRALRHASQMGVILIAATGNIYEGVAYPAAYPFVVGVTALTYPTSVGKWSGHGEAADFCLPGGKVWCATSSEPVDGSPGDARKYETHASTGTTFAAACCSGLAALWLAWHGGRQAIARAYGDTLYRVPQAFRFSLRMAIDKTIAIDPRYGLGVPLADALLQVPLPAAAQLDREEAAFLGECGWFGNVNAANAALATQPGIELASAHAAIAMTMEGEAKQSALQMEALQRALLRVPEPLTGLGGAALAGAAAVRTPALLDLLRAGAVSSELRSAIE